MKPIIFIAIVFLVIGASCKKECNVPNETCNEKPKTDGSMMYFTRWFYDKDKNKCMKISYSGSTAYGFETEQECNECKCR